MNKTIAFLTGVVMLLGVVPVFPVIAEDGTIAESAPETADDYIYYDVYVKDPPPGSSPDAVSPPTSVLPGSEFSIQAVVVNNPDHPIRKINPGAQGNVSWDGWDDWQGTFQKYIPLRFTCKVSPSAGMGTAYFGAVLGSFILTEDGEYLNDTIAFARMEFSVDVMEQESVSPENYWPEQDKPEPYAAEAPRTPEEKISDALRDAMETGSEPFYVTVSYRSYQSDYIDWLTAHTDGDAPWAEKKLAVTASLYEADARAICDAIGVPPEGIGMIWKYSPTFRCSLTKEEIKAAAALEQVRTVTIAVPRKERFIVLNKLTRRAYNQEPESTVLSMLRLPEDGVLPSDRAFDYGGQYLPTVWCTTARNDPLFTSIIFEAKYGDVLEYTGWSSYANDNTPWTEYFRFDSMGQYAGDETVTKLGNALTDEAYADYRTVCNGEPVLAFASAGGNRYLVFPDCLRMEVPFVAEDILPDLGDINDDGSVNASDAAAILQIAALMGAGADVDDLAQAYQVRLPFADADGDGSCNASDAALVLQYAAQCGAQPLVSHDFRSYLYEKAGTVMRVTVGYCEGLSQDHARTDLITSPEELETYFTEIAERPYQINTTDCLVRRDSAKVLEEILAAYPAEFFAQHHLAAFCTREPNHNTCQQIRKILPQEDGTVQIIMNHHDLNGQPVEGRYAVLVAVDKAITDPCQITLRELR